MPIATISGFNPSNDDVQTLAYICITGTSISKLCKEAGIKAIQKIPTKVLNKINHIAMQRFITKFGTKGVINLGKMVPIVGGVIGGTFDYAGTKIIASKAKDIFLYGNID